MNIKKALIELMERKPELTGSAIARAIGRSPAVISQYLNDGYPGDVVKLTGLLGDFIRRVEEKERSARVVMPFVPTATARKVTETVRLAHIEGEITVVYGEAGLGKTVALKQYAKEHTDAVLIEVDPGYTAKVLLEDLCGKLSVNVRGNLHELLEAVINKLQDSGRLIIIDEAELLPYRALEVLRRIHDKTGIGIVLAGMPRLIANLRGKRGEFVQLYSRIAFALNLGNRLPELDVFSIAGSIDLDTRDPDEVNKALYEVSNGNTRRLSKLLKGVVHLSRINNKPVTPAMVREFGQMLIH
jgi:DNA transposition AAA+ family ATPase